MRLGLRLILLRRSLVARDLRLRRLILLRLRGLLVWRLVLLRLCELLVWRLVLLRLCWLLIRSRLLELLILLRLCGLILRRLVPGLRRLGGVRGYPQGLSRRNGEARG